MIFYRITVYRMDELITLERPTVLLNFYLFSAIEKRKKTKVPGIDRSQLMD